MPRRPGPLQYLFGVSWMPRYLLDSRGRSSVSQLTSEGENEPATTTFRVQLFLGGGQKGLGHAAGRERQEGNDLVASR